MVPPPIRVYADTSVFGGAFDAEFETYSLRFFELVRKGRFSLVLSSIVRDELIGAPAHVQSLFDSFLASAEMSLLTPQATDLHFEYLSRKIVGHRHSTDALHVAAATVASCKLLVSWNYSHIVHFQKIPLFNAVNQTLGYPEVWIAAPPEVVPYDKD